LRRADKYRAPSFKRSAPNNQKIHPIFASGSLNGILPSPLPPNAAIKEMEVMRRSTQDRSKFINLGSATRETKGAIGFYSDDVCD
jgi:hypothetical protein